MRVIYSVLIILLAVTNLFAKQEEKAIPVQTDKLSMVFTVREDGKVYFQYFGDKISSDLAVYFARQKNPYFGDYVMDVLTGGGLGDLIRKILIGKREIIIKRHIFKILGFRRLVYNPHAHRQYLKSN